MFNKSTYCPIEPHDYQSHTALYMSPRLLDHSQLQNMTERINGSNECSGSCVKKERYNKVMNVSSRVYSTEYKSVTICITHTTGKLFLYHSAMVHI